MRGDFILQSLVQYDDGGAGGRQRRRRENVIEQNFSSAMHDGETARLIDALGERNQDSGHCLGRILVAGAAQDSHGRVMFPRIEIAADDDARRRVRVEQAFHE